MPLPPSFNFWPPVAVRLSPSPPCSPGFEGGQMPLYRRLPKYVGRPMGPGHTKANFGLLKISVLNKCAANSEVTYESCLEAGHMTKVRAAPPSYVPLPPLHGAPAHSQCGTLLLAEKQQWLCFCSAWQAALCRPLRSRLRPGAAQDQQGVLRHPREAARQGHWLQRRKRRARQAQCPGMHIAPAIIAHQRTHGAHTDAIHSVCKVGAGGGVGALQRRRV